ncbi:LysR family transcriptional regulator ArgP [Dyella sp. LX-66]|uniref:LysR family transcriptional regulator ArgP n=1 Tax=unclassified Dyella TaxID=2634549 RepID=UPI001BE0352E|nr:MULTISPECIES: LysR family transcriptional regulator ArgP [unclassified Dyella]MBT2115558.1 LysR family transcriptional regulator ArgP [Dyella sp. LX-1]MBT2139373.1 LysR family transcriptional regulator ArgP [Dyella sp. LX-66]
MTLLNPQLAAFAAVLGEGSFEGAARRLSVTPSAVSQRIKALEDRLGQVLILRQAPCRATAAGEHLLRSVQQMQLLEAETLQAFAVERAADQAPTTLAIAVNADSLATWFLGALAALHERHGLLFDVRVEDQDHSLDLLRDGSVLGAITADAHPVQGCTARPLGAMRYLPIASPAFVARHFAHGVDAAALGSAPMVVFNRKDALQRRFIRKITRARLAPPTHYLPSSTGFVDAAGLDLGWCMAPESMLHKPLREGTVQAIAPGRWLDVPLYWQHWSVRSATLERLTAALLAAAAKELRQRDGA